METSGAVGWRGVRLLRALARKAKRPGHRDGTIYGTARSATSSFFTHHLSAIAAAVALADALTLEATAAAYAYQTALPRDPTAMPARVA